MSQVVNGAAAHVEKIEGKGGLNIVVRSWRPASAPRAIVAIVPGFNSHSAYYIWVAEQFVASGLAVYAVDLRGRGESDGVHGQATGDELLGHTDVVRPVRVELVRAHV